MPTLDLVLLIASISSTFASFINLIRLDYWWIRMWDFPHLQLPMLAALGLLGWLVLGNYMNGILLLMPVGLLATLTYQFWLIYPFTPLHKKQVLSLSRSLSRAI